MDKNIKVSLSQAHDHLPRLARTAYQGYVYVHWILTIKDRGTGWLTPLFHAQLREVLVHTESRYSFSCPTYCLMPEHIHLLWTGYTSDSDQIIAMEFFRKHLCPYLQPFEWQDQPYDHVLRQKERERGAFASIAFYILENPVRKGLSVRASDYVFSGAVLPGYPALDPHEENFWDLFWRIMEKLLCSYERERVAKG